VRAGVVLRGLIGACLTWSRHCAARSAARHAPAVVLPRRRGDRVGMAKKPKQRRITGGVDTHKDTHHAAVVLMNGRRLADAQFPATSAGYAGLLAWMRGFGRLHAVGVEGTGSYGAALARHLRGQDVTVVEVNRPDRRQRRAKGKSDPLDAYAAADAVLSGRAVAVPKATDGIVESIRVLHLVCGGAVKSRTACINEMRALVVTAPARLRQQLPTATADLAGACARLHPGGDLADPVKATMAALHHLADRYHALSTEITDLDAQLAVLVKQARPDLLQIKGIGVETAAQLLSTCGDNPDRLQSDAAFASLCGVSPVPASSGKTQPAPAQSRRRPASQPRPLRDHYLPHGPRPPNPRLRATPHHRRPVQKEIIRCLKRYIARELYKALTRPKTQAAQEKDLATAA
jgi:transposase